MRGGGVVFLGTRISESGGGISPDSNRIFLRKHGQLRTFAPQKSEVL